MVYPTGATQEVAPQDLFFSITDARGVIKQANSVFVRLSRYPLHELMGAPHNIIRHPSMPGGAFLLMWETLKAGKPFCAYVDNLAADGSRYTVFATITPLGDDYLSVRIPPSQTALLDAARSLYQATRPLELQRREEGASAHAAAVAGLERLAELLVEAGIPSYDAFIQTALPAEVLGRAGALPQRPFAVGALAELLAATHRLHAAVSNWVSQLGQLQQLADDLIAGAEDVHRAADDGNRAAAEFDDILNRREGFSPIAGVLSLWTQMMPEVTSRLTPLAERLEQLRELTATTRFGIALSALHSESMAQFVCELIDDDTSDARPAIADLANALHQGVEEATASLRQHHELSSEVAQEATELAELMKIPTTVLATWQTMVTDQDDDLAKLLPRASEVVQRGVTDANHLVTLAERCREADVVASSETSEALADVQRLARLVVGTIN
ncbi:hypothetical protein [uncultured Tessaracoccus sp.]|uniref:hypothetical protein n=1 Tax=uncultured Tessaracoccus sp. TaxID=905023 RepID=UPI00262016ED|nr:hypothetical protein [uncultured Tessaracoccus sp.]